MPEPADVFCNVPYDRQYQRLYVGLIAGLTGLGLSPRSVLEIPSAQNYRLARIFDLIKECPYSLHDLSRVTLDPHKPKCPRFNMPFEAGLAVGWAQMTPGHKWFVLETQTFRIQKSLSDLNGYDPLIHHGTIPGLMQALMNGFGRPQYPVRPQALLKLNDLLWITARRLKRDHGTIYSRASYVKLVHAGQVAQEEFVKTGQLPRIPL